MTLHEKLPGRSRARLAPSRGQSRGGRFGGAQKGGFGVGLIVGLLIGLALALGVALYVTKVPVPFINKVPQRTAEQDAAEAERNKTWDPNAPLGGKPAARAAAPAAAGAVSATPVAPAKATVQPATAAEALQAGPAARPAAPPTVPAAASPKTAKAGSDPLMYYAQAGAYTRSDDAEAQRAKLALLGLDAKVTERDQSGRTIFRVRTGPFDTRAQAEAVLEKLQAAGVESSLVRVERQ